jgi:hypothetical protein
VVQNQIVRDGRNLHGGLNVYGLCPGCNGLQAKYDDAYKQLWSATRSCWVHGDLVLPRQIAMPAKQIRPGAVARSVLIGLFGLDSRLRELFPKVAGSLLQQQAVDLPRDLQLCVALCRGLKARVSGSVLWTDAAALAGGGRTPLGVNSRGQIYFPPLAWQLVDTDPLPLPMTSLIAEQGWADVSSWLLLDPAHEEPLSALVPSLPPVTHPKWDRQFRAGGMELFPPDTTFILECDNVAAARL